MNQDKPLSAEQPRRFQISPGSWVVAAVLLGMGIALAAYFGREKFEHATKFAYVGPQRCAECHEEQAASWAETRMAQSFDILRAGKKSKEKLMVGLDPAVDYTEDENCLPCHTTGYGKVGGFVSFEETPEMAGVTCEACHGAGGMYVGTVMDADDPSFNTKQAREAGLVYPPTARVCRGCHNEDSPFIDMGYEFDYEERVQRGTHQHFELKYDHGT